jgi:hypothetical protein
MNGKFPVHRVVVLYSVSGVLVNQFLMNQEILKVDTGGLHVGMYQVSVISEEGVFTGFFRKVNDR